MNKQSTNRNDNQASAVTAGVIGGRAADEVKRHPAGRADEDVRSRAADPEKCRRLVDDLFEYVCLPPGGQADRRIAWWEERERLIALEGREPRLWETFDAVARHAERRVRESKMLDEVKDSLTERIFALEEEAYRRHHCLHRPTAAAPDDFRRRLGDMMRRSFQRYQVL